MNIQKFRWSRVYESSEEELTMLLQARKIKARRIVGDSGSDSVTQSQQREVTLWCAEGSLVVRTDTTTTPLQPGDALRIGADTAFELRVGISGYICYIS